MIASQIVTALQTIVARNVDPVEGGVVTIGHIKGGHTYNVIPRDGAHARHRALVRAARSATCWRTVSAGWPPASPKAFGAKADVVFDRAYPATVNDAEATTLARRGAATVAGEARVQRRWRGRPWAARTSPSC